MGLATKGVGAAIPAELFDLFPVLKQMIGRRGGCLLYTSDAADERSSVDLGGRRIIKKKKTISRGGRETEAKQEDK